MSLLSESFTKFLSKMKTLSCPQHFLSDQGRNSEVNRHVSGIRTDPRLFGCPDYAPNFEDWAYWFRVVRVSVRASVRPCMRACVRSSKTVHARVLKFHIWIPRGQIFDARFFSCPSYLPFWSNAPLNKIRMKSDACHFL